jgi:hypothetical protein
MAAAADSPFFHYAGCEGYLHAHYFQTTFPACGFHLLLARLARALCDVPDPHHRARVVVKRLTFFSSTKGSRPAKLFQTSTRRLAGHEAAAWLNCAAVASTAPETPDSLVASPELGYAKAARRPSSGQSGTTAKIRPGSVAHWRFLSANADS